MENPRPEKVAVVDEVRERFESANAALLTEYRGLDVSAISALRRALRAAGGDYKIYKNTLVRFAARDLDLELEQLLTGPTAIAFVTEKPDGSAADAVDVAKALKDFARGNPSLVLKGGLLDGRPLSAEEATALADVEPREVLLAKLAGAIAAPMTQLAGLLQALPRDLAYGLQALLDQQGGAPVEPDAADEDAEPQPETADETTDTHTEPETDTETDAPAAEAAEDTDDTQE
jgi:large subunit ribosomal protein L10